MDSEHQDYENYLIAFTKASQRVTKFIEDADIDLSDIEDPEYHDPIYDVKVDDQGNPLEDQSKNTNSDDGEVYDDDDDEDEGTSPEKPVGWNKFAVNFLTVDSGDHKEYGVFLQMARIRSDKPRLVFFQMNMNTFSKPTIFESDWEYTKYDANFEGNYVDQFEDFVLSVMEGKIKSRDQKLLQKDEL